MTAIGATLPLTQRSGGRQVSSRSRRSATAAVQPIAAFRHRSCSTCNGYASGLTGLGSCCPSPDPADANDQRRGRVESRQNASHEIVDADAFDWL
jgi:hypothetical protein